MTRYRVATFARYAEVLGSDIIEVEIAEPATVAELIIALRSLPGGDLLPANPLIAVNLRQATRETTIGEDDVLALLPPMAGG